MNKLFIVLVFCLTFFSLEAYSQVIKATGSTDRPAGQLILWYDNDKITNRRSSTIEVSNISSSESVWVHVQVYISFDLDGDISTTGDKIRCDERDFFDFYTPLDSHVYIAGPSLTANNGTPLGDSLIPNNTKGFIVITPVVSADPASVLDFRPISFPKLIGTSNINEFHRSFRVNAVGRNAVDFSTGDVLPDFTVVDGTENGFFLIQPDSLFFNFSNLTDTDLVDLVYIAFSDEYNEASIGYRALPTIVTLNPFIQDSVETRISCTPRPLVCFDDLGLGVSKVLFGDSNITGANTLLTDEGICQGNVLQEFPLAPPGLTVGHLRTVITGYESEQLQNVLGLYAVSTDVNVNLGGGILRIRRGGADWMMAEGDEFIPGPDIVSPCDADNENAIIGTAGDDILDGTDGADVIIGLGGNDIIRGFGGDDCIDGGDGADTIEGGIGADDIFGGRGADIINGNRGADIIEGNGGADILNGNRGADTIRGNGGGDQLNGGNGTDNLDGGGGFDSCINGEAVINCES